MPNSISADGLKLIQSFEGFRAEALRLGEGRWLVGHGRVSSSPPAAPLSPHEALDMLREDLAPVEAAVGALVFRHLEPGQFDALVSFAFSIGLERFEASETLRRLNAGDLAGAAAAMFDWRFLERAPGDALRPDDASGEPPVQAEALTRRRAVEIAALLDVGPRPEAPSALAAARPAAAAPPLPGFDHIEARLRRILAAEPATARTLAPPPPPVEAEEETEFTWTAAPQPAGLDLLHTLAQDRLALASLSVAGALLLVIALGLRAGAPGGWGDAAAVVLGAPGAVLAAGGLYLLFAPFMRRSIGRR